MHAFHPKYLILIQGRFYFLCRRVKWLPFCGHQGFTGAGGRSGECRCNRTEADAFKFVNLGTINVHYMCVSDVCDDALALVLPSHEGEEAPGSTWMGGPFKSNCMSLVPVPPESSYQRR